MLICAPLQVAEWDSYIDRCEEKEGELFDQLTAAGHDVLPFFHEVYIRPSVRKAETDDAERKRRKITDQVLDQLLGPAVRAHGNVSELRQTGATGYVGADDDEQLNHVDDLDASNTIPEAFKRFHGDDVQPIDMKPDRICKFDDDDDARRASDADEDDKPVAVEDNGSTWFLGFRITLLMATTMKKAQMHLMEHLLRNLTNDKGSLGAHTMGLGKTLSFLGTADVYSRRHPKTKILLLSPLSVCQNWIDEVDKWDSFLTIDIQQLPTGHDRSFKRSIRSWTNHGGIIVMTHDQFRLKCHELPIDGETILAVDEAHLLKSPTTQLYKAVAQAPTNKKVFLTGTPLQNRLAEFWAIINMLSPGLLGATHGDFKGTYADDIESGMTADATDDERKMCERKVQMLRWRVHDIMCEAGTALIAELLPEKFEYRINHPCSVSIADNENKIVERHSVHVAARTEKTRCAEQLIDAIRSLDNGCSIIVFSERIETLKALKARRDGLLFTGIATEAARHTMVQQFQSKSNDIMYLTTGAGGVGLTLTAARHVIILDPSWNPLDDAQAASRVWRLGQTQTTYVYRLIAEDTLEASIYKFGSQKKMLAARLLEEHHINRVFTREALRDVADDTEIPPVDDSVLTANPILSVMAMQYSIYNHDAIFLDTGASLDIDEESRAQNEYNLVSMQQDRNLYDSAGNLHIIEPGNTRFPDFDGNAGKGERVPAYTPAWDSTDRLNRQLFMRCGPHAIHEIQYRRATRDDPEVVGELIANGIDCGWYSFPPHPMCGSKESISIRQQDYIRDKFYHVQLDMRADDDEYDTDFFPEGDYEFRMRYIDPFDSSVMGPWSDVSAVLSVGQGEAEDKIAWIRSEHMVV
ncbi:hypothetical protein TrST_g8626 [Triparma strigata]|uniref:Uncharacterized protein n=1 Tax=Triparma strigata TaxID=1606541 RepID=A0A9W7C8T1_9STRA|nr:hypothetical protein TrST_g8626 [Triparma strigata]